jgi:hypothetical protein
MGASLPLVRPFLPFFPDLFDVLGLICDLIYRMSARHLLILSARSAVISITMLAQKLYISTLPATLLNGIIPFVPE